MYYGWPLRSLSKEQTQTFHSTIIAQDTDGGPHARLLHTKPAKPKKPSCIELLGVSNRITLAVHGELSVRTKFHNMPVDHLVFKINLQHMSIHSNKQ